MNKYVITTLNAIHEIIRPANDFIFPHLARRLEKLPSAHPFIVPHIVHRAHQRAERITSKTLRSLRIHPVTTTVYVNFILLLIVLALYMLYVVTNK